MIANVTTGISSHSNTREDRLQHGALVFSDRKESRALSRHLGQALSDRLGIAQRPVQSIPVGNTLLHVGDQVTRLAFLVSGRVDLVVHQQGDDGGRIIPVSFGAGEVVLLSQLFSDRQSLVDLVSAEDLVLRWVPIAELEETLLQDRELLLLLVRFLSHRLREVQGRERAWIERGVHERVCAILARLAHAAPRDEGGRPIIVATHEELAARSGVSRPKMSQELKRLEQAGRLRLERGCIRIIDLKDLFDPGG
jgi:CRP-like cAMP-binding protein